jgi:nucleotide-binding universal stress UspA family protein
MKVLLATDGSIDARRAERLVASIRWSTRTRITVLRVDTPFPGDSERPRADLIAIHDAAREEIDEHLRDVAGEIRRQHPRLAIERLTLPGHAAEVIVEHARASKADLVIMGSRGRGAVASAVLGSVAAEVVDHSPCPVLIARTDSIRGGVVADDGSDGARHAEELIAKWPILRGRPVRVVSVADVSPLTTGLVSGVDVGSYAAFDESIRELRHAHSGYARDAEERLAALGERVTSETRTGSVTTEILAVAAETGADLIVVGSRGRTGWKRLLLGSVARGILHGATASVLIVRENAVAPATAARELEAATT